MERDGQAWFVQAFVQLYRMFGDWLQLAIFLADFFSAEIPRHNNSNRGEIKKGKFFAKSISKDSCEVSPPTFKKN